MNLTKWLDALAAAQGKNLSPLQAFEYLQELKTWILTDEQWLEVKSLAKKRADPRFFVSIPELVEIKCEVKSKALTTPPGAPPGFDLFTHSDGRRYAKRPDRKAG